MANTKDTRKLARDLLAGAGSRDGVHDILEWARSAGVESEEFRKLAIRKGAKFLRRQGNR